MDFRLRRGNVLIDCGTIQIDGRNFFPTYQFSHQNRQLPSLDALYECVFLTNNYWKHHVFASDSAWYKTKYVFSPNENQIEHITYSVLPQLKYRYEENNLSYTMYDHGICLINKSQWITVGLNIWMTEECYLTYILGII